MEGNYEFRPDYPNTGYQFVKWMITQDHPIVPVILHSQHSWGRGRMRDLLTATGWPTIECAFGSDYLRHLEETLGKRD